MSYVAVESGSAQGMWRFGIELPGGDSFAVHVRGGAVTACERIETLSGLEAEYTQLCEERGAFFTWPLQQKMDFANTLPAKLALARQRGETVLSEKDLLAISQYGFCRRVKATCCRGRLMRRGPMRWRMHTACRKAGRGGGKDITRFS